MSEQKVYFGNGKEHTFNDGGSIVKLSFSSNDLANMSGNLNEKGYINLVLSKRREEGKYGETHYMTLDTWKPTPQGGQQGQQQQANPAAQPQVNKVENNFDNFDENIPF